MTFSKIGRIVSALVASAALGLSMTGCGGGTIGYMWILGNSLATPGTQSGQITGYRIDDFTGNLTAIPHSPFTSGGSVPKMLVVKPGGRFVYVVNQGSSVGATDSNVVEFSVGGDGTLSYQETFYTQGTVPIYLSFDSSGNFLYVLDKQAPDYNGTSNQNGAITGFSVASDTGRLTLLTNLAVLNPNGTPTTYFEVGPNPVMSRLGSSNCLYTLSPTEIFPYIISSSTGQLTLAQTGPLVLGSAPMSLTSINTSSGTSAGSFVYLTDGGQNQILSLEATGTNCQLTAIAGSTQTNSQINAVPTNSLTSNNGKFLYVLNNILPTTTGTTIGSISAYTIESTGLIFPLPDPNGNLYPAGANPTCIVEDPTSQYFYISNNVDSTVTGKLLNQNTGFLSNLTHGSSFPVAMNPTCLVVSGSI